MKQKTKSFLLSLALIILCVCIFGVTGAALNAGDAFHTIAGIVNGVAEFALLIYVFVKLMDKKIL